MNKSRQNAAHEEMGRYTTEQAFDQALSAIDDPFQVAVVYGKAGCGKSSLIARATAHRSEVVIVTGTPGAELNLAEIDLPTEGALVIDEVLAYSQDSIRRALAELAQQVRAGERKMFVVLIVQHLTDLEPYRDLLPRQLVAIEVKYRNGLAVAVGPQEHVLADNEGQLAKLAFVDANAERMFNAAFEP